VAGAGEVGGSGDPGGSDVGAAVDDEVDGEAGRCAGAQGHSVSPKTVARLLGDHGYSLRATTKTVEGTLLDTNTYEKGIKITDKQMRAFEAQHLQRHEFHGNWNYTVRDVQEQADQQTPRPTTGAQ